MDEFEEMLLSPLGVSAMPDMPTIGAAHNAALHAARSPLADPVWQAMNHSEFPPMSDALFLGTAAWASREAAWARRSQAWAVEDAVTAGDAHRAISALHKAAYDAPLRLFSSCYLDTAQAPVRARRSATGAVLAAVESSYYTPLDRT